MVESFKNAGVVDGQLVKQDADDEKNSTRNLKAALNKPPDEPLGLFGFDCLNHVGKTVLVSMIVSPGCPG